MSMTNVQGELNYNIDKMRLKIKVRREQNPHESQKQLVYIPEEIKTIREVQQHLKDILQIKGDLVLRLGEYLLPKRESLRVLEEGNVVDCYVQGKKRGSNLKDRNVTSESEEESQGSSSSSQVEIKVKKSMKKAKLTPTRKQKKYQSSSSESESSDQSSSEQSESNKSVPINRIEPRKISIELPSKLNPRLTLPQTKSTVNQDKLKNYLTNKVVEIPKVPNPNLVTQFYPAKTIEYKPANLPSQSDQKQPIKQPLYKLVDLAKQKQFQSKTNTSKSDSVPKPIQPKREVAKSIVIASREETPDLWREIPVKSIEKYSEAKGQGFLEKGDEIQYKVTEFDQEKYVPVLSDWIPAKVQQTDGKGSLTILSNHKQIKMSEINMFGLRIKPQLLKGERKAFLESGSSLQVDKHQKKPVQTSTPSNTQLTTPTVSTNPLPPVTPVSKKDELIKQLNYYFSENNYKQDNYLKMHASKHKQQYIPLKCFMNFNKLKPLVSNQGDLEAMIRSSDLTDSTFEVHPQNRMIRKKQTPPTPTPQ